MGSSCFNGKRSSIRYDLTSPWPLDRKCELQTASYTTQLRLIELSKGIQAEAYHLKHYIARKQVKPTRHKRS